MESIFSREPTQAEQTAEQRKQLRRQHRVAERGQYHKQKEITDLRSRAKSALRAGQTSVAYDAVNSMLLKEGVRRQYAATGNAVESMQAMTEQMEAGRALLTAQAVSRDMMEDMNEFMADAQADGTGNWQSESQQFAANMQQLYGNLTLPYAAGGVTNGTNPNDAAIRAVLDQLAAEISTERTAGMAAPPMTRAGAPNVVYAHDRPPTPTPAGMVAGGMPPPPSTPLENLEMDDPNDAELMRRLANLKK